MVARLWAACGLPDFRKSGLDPHARFVARVFGHLAEGYIPHQWFADEIARLDTVAGDVETLAGRIASVRSWAYIANRKDWLADPAHWAGRTREVEERLSDALHASLTQRFVDKRTTALMRRIGADAGALPVVIGAQGEVLVEDHAIGRLDGFRFTVDASARAGDRKLLLAAAERHLTGERARRGEALAAADDADIALDGVAVMWSGHAVAALEPGASLARPKLALDRTLDCLSKPLRAQVQARLDRWLAERLAQHVPTLARLAAATQDAGVSPAFRVIAAAAEDQAGIAARLPLRDAVAALTPDERKQLRRIGLTVGALDLFDPRLLKPAAARWRQVLLNVRGRALSLAPDGASVVARGSAGATLIAGFRPFGRQAVRVDLVERVARAAHDGRPKGKGGREAFAPDPALATSMGMEAATVERLMVELGFRKLGGEEPRWAWRGRPVPKRQAVRAPTTGAFAGLAELVGNG